MVNQLVLGEVVELLGEPADGWFLVRAPDGYEGMATAGGVRPVAQEDAAAWTAAADGFSLGTPLRLDEREPSRTRAVGGAPWGGRLPRAAARETDGRIFLLPDGRRVEAENPERIVFGPERALAYEATPEATARTALSWMGAPYLWGGRIREGTDCSGFVQAVYSLHGFRLPRDSRDQFSAGPAAANAESSAEEAAANGRPGDLWFFAWDGEPVSHVGIRLEDGSMLHASETRGCVAIDRLGTGEFGRLLERGFVGAVRPAT